jgi:hypothetical protein
MLLVMFLHRTELGPPRLGERLYLYTPLHLGTPVTKQKKGRE